MTRWLLLVLALAGLAGGCVTSTTGEDDVEQVWDLRETHAIEAVGWPEDAGSAFESGSEDGVEQVLLPGDLTIDGPFTLHPSRRGGIGDAPYAEVLQDLLVTFETESVDEVAARARDLATRLGVDVGDIPAWAAQNGGTTTATSQRGELPGGVTVRLSAQTFNEGDAVLDLLVTWPRDGA